MVYEETDFLTSEDLMDILYCTKEEVYNLFTRDDFPKVKFGDRYLIPKKELAIWLDKEFCLCSPTFYNGIFNTHSKERETGYFVYRFLSKDNHVLYIGKTKELRHRMNQHLKKKSNTPPECIDQIDRIQFLAFSNECDMCLYEIYLINYYCPPYNKDSKSGLGEIRLELPHHWNTFDKDTMCVAEYHEWATKRIQEKPQPFKFNYHIFINDQLDEFIEKHGNSFLTNDDKKQLAGLCYLDYFDIDKVNNIIPYNNPKAQLYHKDQKIYLQINEKGAKGHGHIAKVKNGYTFSYRINRKMKYVRGSTREELGKKILDMLLLNSSALKA